MGERGEIIRFSALSCAYSAAFRSVDVYVYYVHDVQLYREPSYRAAAAALQDNSVRLSYSFVLV